MAEENLRETATGRLYPVTLDPDKPVIALGMPKEIFALILQSRAEMVQAILNCGLVEDRTDPETGKQYVLFKRNLSETEDTVAYLDEALAMANMFFEKIATLMSEQDVADSAQGDNYWRLLIDLKKEWREGIEGIEGSTTKPDGERLGDARIQWNDGKGIIRVKTQTLAGLKQQTYEAIFRILEHLGGFLNKTVIDGHEV